MATVTRTYQLGGKSEFEATNRAGLLAVIEQDARDQRGSGDVQGIGYSVASAADAKALGCYETQGGEWVIDGTEQVLLVTN